MRQRKPGLLIFLVILGFIPIVFLFPRLISQQEQPLPEWHSIGPAGASVQKIIIDPSDSRVLYAAVWQGPIYKSIDGAQSWVCISNENGPSGRTLAVDPKNPQVLYVGDFGIYKSADGGTSWGKLPTSFDGRVSRIAVDPVNSQTIYAATSGTHPMPGGIYKSTDGGYSWSAKNAGLISPPDASPESSGTRTWGGISDLAVDPQNPNIIYASTSGRGICKSTNGGASWTEKNNGLKCLDVRKVTVVPGDPKTIYAWAGVTYRSEDGGSSWTAAGASLPGNVLGIHPKNPSIVYMETKQKHLRRSTDGGASWKTLSLPHEDWTLAMDPGDSRVIYLGTEGAGIFKSTDRGDSWIAVNNGFENLHIRNLEVNPADPQIIYARIAEDISEISHCSDPSRPPESVYRSSDGGDSWKPLMGLHGHVLELAMDPTNSNVIYAGMECGGIYRSEDGGSSWKATGSGLAKGNAKAIRIHPRNSQILYAGIEGEGVYKSIDGGNLWVEKNVGLDNLSVSALRIDPKDPRILYAGTEGGGVFKSIDGANSWAIKNTGLDNLTVTTLQINPSDSRILYAGTDGDGIYKSFDGGNSWKAKNSGLTLLHIKHMVIDWSNPQNLYVATEPFDWRKHQVSFIMPEHYGFFRSKDGGDSWANVGFVSPMTALAIDSKNPSILYASGAMDGTLRSIDRGDFWNEISDTRMRTFLIDLKDSQIIYAAPNWGSGIWKSTNAGESWIILGEPEASWAFDRVDPQIVYVGSSDGIFKSIDGGNTWQLAARGSYLRAMTDPVKVKNVYAPHLGYHYMTMSTDGGQSWFGAGPAVSVCDVATDPTNPQVMYAATASGVWKSTDGGEDWDMLGELFASVWMVEIDPTDPEIIYAATEYGLLRFDQESITKSRRGD